MAAPWEKYASATPSSEPKAPWEKYSGGGSESAPAAPPVDDEGMFHKGLRYGAKVLDYPGGLMRTGLAATTGLIAGKPDIVKPEDVTSAFKGEAPPSSEYLKRLGVDEGPTSHVPLLGDVSTRDLEGFGLDVATDPLTLAAKAARGGSRLLRAAISPASEATEAVGKSAYKSGLKKIDERLVEKGAKPVSEILMQEGKTGTTKTLAKDADQIGKQLGTERAAVYGEVDKLGAKVDMNTAFKKSEGLLSKMKEDPGLRPMAEQMEETLNRYKAEGPVDIAKASDWKTNLYDSLPQSAYDVHGKLKGPAKKLQKAMATDFKTAIVDTANEAKPGLGDAVDAINEKWQSIIQAQKPFDMQIRRGETPNLFSSVDAMIGGYGLHSPTAAAGMLAVKKAADVAKTTYARTKAGMGLIKVAETGAPDILARKGLINSQRPGQSEDLYQYSPSIKQATK